MALSERGREGERDRKCIRQAEKPLTIVCYNAVLCQTNHTPPPCFQLNFHFFPAIAVSYPLLRPHLSDSTSSLIHFANRSHFTKHADAFQGTYFAFKFYPTGFLVQTCSNEIKGMFETVRLFLERYASRHEAAFNGRPGHRQEQERERTAEGEGAVYVREVELDSRKKRSQKIKKFFRLRQN